MRAAFCLQYSHTHRYTTALHHKDIDWKLLEIKLGRVQFQKGLVSVSLQLSLFFDPVSYIFGWVGTGNDGTAFYLCRWGEYQ